MNVIILGRSTFAFGPKLVRVILASWALGRPSPHRDSKRNKQSFSFNLSPQLATGHSFVRLIQTFARMYCGEERKEEEEEEKEEKQKQRQKQNNKPIDSSPPRVILEPPGFFVRLIIGCGCGCGCLCGTILPAVALRSRLGASLVKKKAALASMARRC